MRQPFVIGIAGGTGSGKTTITRAIEEKFAPHASVIFHDSYYKSNDDLPFEDRVGLNYDAPEAFDNELLIEHLNELIAGRHIDAPVYNYAEHTRDSRTERIDSAPVIIVEGILILADPRICALCDVKIFVDTDADVRILRRIKRDVVERGRSIESIEEQYYRSVKPMHDLHVEPSKRKADIIIPEGGSNVIALEMLFHRVGAVLADNS